MTEQKIKPALGPMFGIAVVANVLAGVLLLAYVLATVLATVYNLAIFYYFLTFLSPLAIAVPVAIIFNIILGVKYRKTRDGLSTLFIVLTCVFVGFAIYAIL